MNTRLLLSGLAGAVSLNVVHECARMLLPQAPRMDRVGARGLRMLAQALGARGKASRPSYLGTLVADVASNALFYALIGRSSRPRTTGMLLGAAAGLGAVVLTPKLGLGRDEVRRTTSTALMTVAWYTLGGLVAGWTSGPRHQPAQLAAAG